MIFFFRHLYPTFFFVRASIMSIFMKITVNFTLTFKSMSFIDVITLDSSHFVVLLSKNSRLKILKTQLIFSRTIRSLIKNFFFSSTRVLLLFFHSCVFRTYASVTSKLFQVYFLGLFMSD